MDSNNSGTNGAESKLMVDYQEKVYRPTTIEDGPLESNGKSTSRFLYIAAFTVNMVSFACGVAFSWTSPIIPKLDGSVEPENNPLPYAISSLESSWLAGILPLGAAIGPIVAGKLADTVGRKRTLLYVAAPLLISFIFLAYSKTILMFYLCRILKGIGVGSTFTVLPMYIGEIAENHNRGSIGCLFIVFIAMGLLFSYLVGPYLSVKLFCLSCTIPLIIFLVGMYFIPDSPVYLASVGNKKAAQEAMMKLRSKKRVDEIQDEFQEMLKNVEEANSNKGGVKLLFQSYGLKKAFVICTGLLLFQQVSGINIVLSFMQTIFNATGSVIPSSISSIVIGIIKILSTVTTFAIVEKSGKRILLLLSITGCCLSLFMLGGYFFLKEQNVDVSKIFWLPILSLIIYIISFNLGLGPLPWAIMAELFPSNVKSVASTLNSSFCFFSAFLITLVFPTLVKYLGMAKAFWLFGGCCVFGILFVLKMVPETKGKTLSEIQHMLSKR